MKSPHILFIARRFPPSIGGMERFAYDLSEALKQKSRLYLVVWGRQSRLSIILALPFLFFMSFWKLLANGDITVIHSQDAVNAPLAWLLAKLFNKPFVVVAHGLDITYQNRFYQITVLWFVRRADRVIAISHTTRDEAIKRGVLPEKITIITPGIADTKLASVKNKTKTLDSIGLSRLADKHLLLTVGRLVKRKGVAWFVAEVLPELYQANPDIHYIVIGEGIERQTIEAVIKEKALENAVSLLGSVSESVKNKLYQVSDIFVMPNIKVEGDMEGFGIVAIEAAVARLPVVAADLEGIRDALQDQKNGWLVKPHSSKTFKKVITTLLASETDRHSFGEKARTYSLNQFRWGSIATKFSGLYEAVEPHNRKHTRLVASSIILLITLVAFLSYIQQNPELLHKLSAVTIIDLIGLIVLYGCMFSSLLAMLYFSLLFYRKKIPVQDNFLVSSYSSLTNFFGPTQAGSGVRAVYLKAKMKLTVKDFIFISLIYYAFYASLSVIMLFTGAGLQGWAIVAAIVVMLFSASLIYWYNKRSKLRQTNSNPKTVVGIFLATAAQVMFQSIIYFLEILKFEPHASFAHAVSYTGAANFSLFVSLTPGAIGIREAFLLFSQSLHHISSNVIVSAGVLDRAVYVVFLGLLFLCVSALHGRKKIQELRSSE